MRTFLNQHFGFSRRAYNGLLVLMAMLLLVSAFPYLYGLIFPQSSTISSMERTMIRKLVFIEQQEQHFYRRTKSTETESRHPTFFRFDPNRIGLLQWQQLGLSTKQAQSIINYRNKGGRFFQPSDLKRMYTITPVKFAALEPYIEIQNQPHRNNMPVFKNIKFEKKTFIPVELNSADTLQLDQIRGIGAAFARRIVNYRERLGGFYKKEQLLEVFGLDSAKFKEIESQVVLDAENLKRIAINTVEFEELKQHPYLKYKQINAIIQYRKQHGKYNNIDDLKKVIILSPQNIQNLAPYLTFK